MRINLDWWHQERVSGCTWRRVYLHRRWSPIIVRVGKLR